MKIPQFFVFLSSFLILTACNKNDDPDDSFSGKRDYFSCKIDGMVFEPRAEHGCHNMTVDYYPKGTNNLNAGFFAVSARDCKSDIGQFTGFSIVELNSVKKFYQMPGDSVRSFYRVDSMLSNLDSSLNGNIHFSTLMPQCYDESGIRTETGKVEGSFEYTLVFPNGKTVKITDGRFGFFNIQ